MIHAESPTVLKIHYGSRLRATRLHKTSRGRNGGYFLTTSRATPEGKCDLLIKGGTLIDPGRQFHAPMDIAVLNG